MSGLVLVVGDLINDIVVQPLGETTVDSDTPSRVTATPGGSGGNVARWLALLGTPVRLAARAGTQDAAAHERVLRGLGVDARITSDEERATGTIVILVGAHGERSMYTDRGAGAALSPADLPASLLEGAALLHVSGYCLFTPPGREAVRALSEAALEKGCTISVDPNSVAHLRSVGRKDFLRWTTAASVVLPNLDEGRELSGVEEPGEIVASLLSSYETVSLKLGPAGVLAASRSGAWVRLPAPTVPVVDTTGAGDAFAAGFLSVLVRRGELEEAARSGLEAAGRAVSRAGGSPPAQVVPK